MVGPLSHNIPTQAPYIPPAGKSMSGCLYQMPRIRQGCRFAYLSCLEAVYPRARSFAPTPTTNIQTQAPAVSVVQDDSLAGSTTGSVALAGDGSVVVAGWTVASSNSIDSVSFGAWKLDGELKLSWIWQVHRAVPFETPGVEASST